MFWLRIGAILVVMAFVAIAGGDAMDGGSAVNRIYELGCLGTGVALLYLIRDIHTDYKPQHDPAVLVVGVLSLYAFASATWSPNLEITLAKSVELFLVVVAAYFTATTSRRWMPQAHSLADVLVPALLGAVGLCLVINTVIWGTPIAIAGDIEDPNGRPRLIFGNAHALTVADLLALAAIATMASRWRWWLKAITVLGLAPLMVLTDARAPSVGLCFALAVVCLLKIRSVAARWLTSMAVMATTIVVFFSGILPDQLVGDQTRDDAVTLNGRTELWHHVIDLIWTGSPAGRGFYASRYVLTGEFEWAGHAHNALLEIGLSLGAPGLALGVMFIALLFINFARTRDIFVIGTSIYTLVHSYTNPILLAPGFPMFVLTAALIYAEARHVRGSVVQVSLETEKTVLPWAVA